MKFPVSEKDLESCYGEIIAEIDRLSLQRADKIWEAWPKFLNIAGTWECLRKIHAELFGGLFTFAGQLRTVNISKSSFRLANVIFLEKIIPVICEMPQKNFDDILSKYVEMNIAHPFREGNGRAMRLWLDAMLEREAGMRVDWRKISRSAYISAMERSPVNTLEISALLKNAMIYGEALTDKIIFTGGLEVSYSYEKF